MALATGSLTLSGGTFTLTADANFGASFGLIALYFKSQAANIAASGVIRLASTDLIAWRNNANNADVQLSKNSSDNLVWPNSMIAAAFSTATANPAASGVFRLANTDAIAWRNNANNADILLSKNASDQLTYAANIILSSAGIVPIGAGGTNSGTALNNNRFIVSSGGAIIEAANPVVAPTPINMNSQKITNLTNGSGAQDAAAFGQIPSVSNAIFTPTLSAGVGTISNANGFYQQIGNMVHVWGSFQCGTTAASNVAITVPTGSITYTNRAPTNGSQHIGVFFFNDGAAFGSANKFGVIFLDGSDTSKVYLTAHGSAAGTANFPKDNGSGIFNSNDYVSFDFWYAIA